MTERQINHAAYFWQKGRDTVDIARLLAIAESVVCENLHHIRTASRRIAISAAVERRASPYESGRLG